MIAGTRDDTGGVLDTGGVDLSPAVALFRSLGDATRLAIVHELASGERRVADLTRSLRLAQSTVSAHVACLRDCGLVDGRPVGRQMLYSLTRPELLAVLDAAEQLLAATGNAVALCPASGDLAHGDVATSSGVPPSRGAPASQRATTSGSSLVLQEVGA